METGRLKRYKDKMDLISKRIAQVEEWQGEILEEEKTMLASYKAFQEAAEAALDLVAMMIKDAGSMPKDDYSNIELALGKKLISRKTGDALKQANGLRNRLVHEYNGLNAKRACESILELLPMLDGFLGEVAKWLEKA